MLGMKVDVQVDTKPVEEAAEKAAYKNLGHMAASIRKETIRAIKKSKKPAAEGQPVHTRAGLAKRAVLYHVDPDGREAIVGFSADVVGEAMAAHEHGGQYRGTDYPARPTIGPAFEAALPRMGPEWEGAIEREA